MLDLSRVKPELTMELDLSNYAGTIEEGMGLQWVTENGAGKVTPGTGAANTNVFAGVALSYFGNTTQAVFVDTLTVDPTAYTVTLSQVPVAATGILVKNLIANPDGYPPYIGGGTTFTYQTGAAPANAGSYVVASNVLTFNSNMAGQQVIVTYRYNLTVQQAQALIGVGVPGNVMPADVTGTIGVIQKGIVWTSNFNTQYDWTQPDIGPGGTVQVTLGANGLFQLSSTGAGYTPTGAAVNATVVGVPSADQPYLGLYLRG